MNTKIGAGPGAATEKPPGRSLTAAGVRMPRIPSGKTSIQLILNRQASVGQRLNCISTAINHT